VEQRFETQRNLDPTGVSCFGWCSIPSALCLSDNPPRVRFTGVLLPNKDPSRKGLLDDLEVFIGNEKSTFVLDKMKIVGSVGLNRATLQRLFPPVIRFVGSDDLMRRLKSPKIMGKVITIEGLLYTGSRMLLLTEVDDGEEAGTI
jgi:hypothetical protein